MTPMLRHLNWSLLVLLALVALLPVCGNAATASNAPAASKAKAKAATPGTAPTNAAPAEAAIPKSHFAAVPETGGGKDPFFPASTRFQPRQTTVGPSNKVVVVVEPDVRINGFSGNASLPLVIINNVTFGIGDERLVKAENLAGNVRLRVRCLEIQIDDQMAIVEVNGTRRELRFLKKK